MIINFVGNFQSGYVGEVSDETHLARELKTFGNVVNKIPRDEWREHVLDGKPYPNVPYDLKADINIITKWHHFFDGRFIHTLQTRSEAPVFYWVWDYMQGEDWHMKMVDASNLYLANDVRNGHYKDKNNVYYFPFDVADMSIYLDAQNQNKKYDVSFFGSWIGQGDRQQWLTEINKYIPIKAFSWNAQDWPKEFDVSPAVYGYEFVKAVKQTKICLGFSVNPTTWGYWSNRTGKTLLAGGFLLYQYAPGMELFFRDGVEYFSSIEEVKEKIDHYLIADTERQLISQRGKEIAWERMSSRERIIDLLILIDRYLKSKGEGWKI